VSTIVLDSVLAESLELAWSVHSIIVQCWIALLKGFKMKAYKHLVKFALKHGCTVSVWDGEEWQVKRSTGYKAIIEAIESVEEAALRLRDNQGLIIGSVSVSAFGLEDDETITDYTINPFMDLWEESYKSKA
jgi:hypothetical protein